VNGRKIDLRISPEVVNKEKIEHNVLRGLRKQALGFNNSKSWKKKTELNEL
jgi:hypothetical protein